MIRGGFSFFALILALLIVSGLVVVSYPYIDKNLKDAREVANAIKIKDSNTNKNVEDVINPPILPPIPPTEPELPLPPQIDESEFYLPSVYRYGRTLLNATEQKVYDEVLSGLIAYDANNLNIISGRPVLNINISPLVDLRTLIKILGYINTDAPETFHVASFVPRAVEMVGNNIKKFYVYIHVSYNTRDKYINTLHDILEVVKSIVMNSLKQASDIYKIKYIHDELIKLVSYGGISSSTGGNIVGAFINRKVVCDGYSRAFLLLLQRSGFSGLYTTGYAYSNSSWILHAWNIIYYQNSWYYIDTTWDDPPYGSISSVKWIYFMKGSLDFNSVHNNHPDGLQEKKSYPSLPGTSQSSVKGDWIKVM